jgi:NADPH:quinone reductase
MQALIHDPDAPSGLRLGEAPDPEPGRSQALVEVRALSVNFADVAFLADRYKPRAVAGFDASGIVAAQQLTDRGRRPACAS